MKIAIIGSGRIAPALAYALVLKGLGDFLQVANGNKIKDFGDALDLHRTLVFCDHQMQIKGSQIAEIPAGDIVLIFASAPAFMMKIAACL